MKIMRSPVHRALAAAGVPILSMPTQADHIDNRFGTGLGFEFPTINLGRFA